MAVGEWTIANATPIDNRRQRALELAVGMGLSPKETVEAAKRFFNFLISAEEVKD